jgi:hypothetical protein
MADAREVLPRLRTEAEAVKQCFATFCFQAVAFSAALLTAIAAYGSEHPEVNLVSALIAVLALAVCRIGTYKYATANRNYGFELFVDRLTRMRPETARRYTEASLSIGWEEALRAWRIVQASIFEKLYWHRFGSPNFPTRDNCTARKRDTGAWWDVASLVKKNATYHPGSYLKSMHTLLALFVVASWLPLLFLCADAVRISTHPFHPFLWPLVGGVALFILGCLREFIWLRQRRTVLERGLLSIHSCSIVWEVVTVAHLRAVAKIADHHFNGYTQHLASLTSALTSTALTDVHAWLAPTPVATAA